MRFANKKEDFLRTVEAVGLIISMGAVFLQIWILLSGIESFFKGNYSNLFPSMILSGFAFLACLFSIFLTKIDFLKGMNEGRSKSYQKKNY